MCAGPPVEKISGGVWVVQESSGGELTLVL